MAAAELRRGGADAAESRASPASSRRRSPAQRQRRRRPARRSRARPAGTAAALGDRPARAAASGAGSLGASALACGVALDTSVASRSMVGGARFGRLRIGQRSSVFGPVIDHHSGSLDVRCRNLADRSLSMIRQWRHRFSEDHARLRLARSGPQSTAQRLEQGIFVRRGRRRDLGRAGVAQDRGDGRRNAALRQRQCRYFDAARARRIQKCARAAPRIMQHRLDPDAPRKRHIPPAAGWAPAPSGRWCASPP